jgi:hypothetical protein
VKQVTVHIQWMPTVGKLEVIDIHIAKATPATLPPAAVVDDEYVVVEQEQIQNTTKPVPLMKAAAGPPGFKNRSPTPAQVPSTRKTVVGKHGGQQHAKDAAAVKEPNNHQSVRPVISTGYPIGQEQNLTTGWDPLWDSVFDPNPSTMDPIPPLCFSPSTDWRLPLQEWSEKKQEPATVGSANAMTNTTMAKQLAGGEEGYRSFWSFAIHDPPVMTSNSLHTSKMMRMGIIGTQNTQQHPYSFNSNA